MVEWTKAPAWKSDLGSIPSFAMVLLCDLETVTWTILSLSCPCRLLAFWVMDCVFVQCLEELVRKTALNHFLNQWQVHSIKISFQRNTEEEVETMLQDPVSTFSEGNVSIFFVLNCLFIF